MSASELASLRSELQAIVDRHSAFWNASMSFAVYNSSVDVAVAAGKNDYAAGTWLTNATRIPMGSTTKQFTAVAALRLAEQGTILLDEPIAPHVDRYLALPQPCERAPSMCVPTCVPVAHCLTRPGPLCAGVSRERRATCSYCLRFLHCWANATAGVPAKATLRQLWDGEAAIEAVTYRHLLSMRAGLKDYYDDRTNWSLAAPCTRSHSGCDSLSGPSLCSARAQTLSCQCISLLTLSSGCLYAACTVSRLYRQVMGSTRDVEPLEFLLHQDHAFLFPPGGTTTVPAGAPGAGSTVQRGAHSTSGASHVHGHTRDMPAPPPIGAYSTNGFALVGLALAGGLSDWARLRLRRTASPHTSSLCTGALGLADWADLDQRALAWGDRLPADDATRFFGRGTCLSYRGVARQYTGPAAGRGRFLEISNHSCLNSFTGGNIGAAPRDVARFTHAAYSGGRDALLSPASVAQMTTFHPLTDGFGAFGLAYGLGLEGRWERLPNGSAAATPSVVCGTLGRALGHSGFDYGSGSELAHYFTDLQLGVSFAMTSAVGEGSGLAGMNCSLPFGAQERAAGFAIADLLNAVATFAGLGAPCPTESYDPPPAPSCVDAPSFGTFNGAPLSCAALLAAAAASSHLSPEQLCDGWLGRTTLGGVVAQEAAKGVTYSPPPGAQPTTVAWELCRGSCLAAGTGPCWLRAKGGGWCGAPPSPPPGDRREHPRVVRAAIAARAVEATAAMFLSPKR